MQPDVKSTKKRDDEERIKDKADRLLNLDCVLMVDDLSCTFETHIGGRPYNPVSFSCWVHSNFHNNEYTKRCAAVK